MVDAIAEGMVFENPGFYIMHLMILAGNARSLVANRGDLIEQAKASGHKVSAAVPKADILDGVYELGIDIYPFELSRATINPWADIKAVFYLRGLIREANPDVVFSYNIKPVVYGSIASRMVGVSCYYSMITGLGAAFADNSSLKSKILRRAAAMLYRSGMKSSHRVFFQNPDDFQDFLDLGILKDKSKAVRTMGSGVNMKKFPKEPLPDGPPVFLFIARLLRGKGVAEFVDAARKVKGKWPEARCVVVGPHDASLPHSVPLESLKQWKEEGVVEFVGGVQDVRPWLRKCSVFVLPSYYREGTPRSALEAMATGRPVITTDSPGCRETVRDGENGFLVKPRDAESLAEAMMRFHNSPDLLARMGEASYQRVVEDYDVRRVNDVILNTMGLA